MKRYVNLLLIFALVLGLCACGKGASAPTWQEWYDLGVKYLSEGNYEEAIIAFTAAIEIDQKQPMVYSGRAKAYVLSGETAENLAAALADFETALGLDETLVEAWLGLADVYIRQGDHERALEVLKEGMEKADDDLQIADMLNKLKAEDEASASGASLFWGGSGKNMTVSLEIPELPQEVYVVDDNTLDSLFCVSFSNGTETFFVHVTEAEGVEGFVSVSDGSVTVSRFGCVVYDTELEDIIWDDKDVPVEAICDNNTITWTLQLPEWACSVEDIRYIGYDYYYKTEESGAPINLSATYTVTNGELAYYGDMIVEGLGFVLSSEEAQYHY